MNWSPLDSQDQLTKIKEQSQYRPQVIFKHSTRCSVSSMAKTRLERAGMPDSIDFHLLDLLRFRNLSDQIAEDFSVYHESPQVLIIRNNECIFDESHNGINMDEIIEQVSLN